MTTNTNIKITLEKPLHSHNEHYLRLSIAPDITISEDRKTISGENIKVDIGELMVFLENKKVISGQFTMSPNQQDQQKWLYIQSKEIWYREEYLSEIL